MNYLINCNDVENISIALEQFVNINFNSLESLKKYLLENKELLNITQVVLKKHLGFINEDN
ncbi:MAG: hypothetical protein ACK5HP_04675 [Bacilli bacterium]